MLENTVPDTEGNNNFGTTRYQGPCPPTGTHRYFFKLYALDKILNTEAGSNHKTLKKAMRAQIIDYTELTGLCRKSTCENMSVE